MTFQDQIKQGIPMELPFPKPYDSSVNHAPKRKDILSNEEKKIGLTKCVTVFRCQTPRYFN